MKRSILMITSLVVMSVLAVAQSPRHKKEGERPEGQKQRFEKIVQHLELSNDQQKQFQDIHFNSKKAIMPLKNELAEKEARLYTLSTSDNVDMKALKSIANEIGDLRNDIFLTKLESDQKIRSILNEQQRLKFDLQGKRHKSKKRHG